MTTYFFHLRSQDTLLEDCEGTDLPSLQDALLQVLQVRSELAADPDGDVDGIAFEVTDSSGRLLLRVPPSVQTATVLPPPYSRSPGWTLGAPQWWQTDRVNCP